MTATLRKWKAVFAIFVQEGLAYRASGIIWIFTDLTNALTMPLVWAHASGGAEIGGMRAGDFIVYYLAILLLGSFVTSHIMWEIATEIREGIFSTHLVRPISFYQFSFFRNLSWRLLRMTLTLPFFLLLLYLYRGYLGDFQPNLGPEFWISFVLGHLVSFGFVIMMSMLALFVQEAMAIFELYYVPQLFLSGYLFPITLLPDWARQLSMFFPFFYTLGAPTSILVNQLKGPEAWRAIGMQCVWIVVCYLLSRVLWRKGLKHYTGVGM